jgi:hypothetical protein
VTDLTEGKPRSLAEERPELLTLCGLLGYAGNLAPLPALLLAITVAQHDLVADTISDLGRGPHHWIMDTGFYLNAGGLLALAIGAAHLHLGRWFWSLGILCLALLALVITLLGIWDEFHSVGSETARLTVHTKLSFALAPLFLIGPLAMARGAAKAASRAGTAFAISAVLWAIFATAFKLAPTAYDGILEKAAVAATWGWTLPLSHILLRRGLADARRVA